MAKDLAQTAKFILYTSPNGDVKFEVFVQNETVWLTQEQMSVLFNKAKSTINEHIQNVYAEKELVLKETMRKFGNSEFSDKPTNYYNLDVIISVGYRVKSLRGTQFRIWATQVLREYIIKGFVLNDERLKQGEQTFKKDYFKELLERVRSIRASERRIYQQITDIFAECSTDYNPSSEATRDFFSSVQNKFHFAIAGQTTAEIINKHADKQLPNMGLSTWKNAPTGRILPTDVTIAKNYLTEDKIKRLERTISGFFDYIENLIENKQTFTMEQFAKSVDKFLTFNEYKILGGRGKISKEIADKKALAEYKEFNKTQPIESDFDKVVKRLIKGEGSKPNALPKHNQCP